MGNRSSQVLIADKTGERTVLISESPKTEKELRELRGGTLTA